MLKFSKISALCLGFAGLVISCGPTGNMNQTASTESNLADSEAFSSEESATLGLAGQGDRICRLDYSFVKKDAKGNYSKVGDGSTTDNLPRTGFGRGCLNFCVATFDELMKNNQPNGVEILIKGCQFAQTATPAASKFQTTLDACKVVQADQKVIFAENKTRAECVTECAKFEGTNPSRRCEWGAEVLRAHPLNACNIRGAAGKQLYQANVTRFQCRMECKARAQTNPNRSCLWGGENVKE